MSSFNSSSAIQLVVFDLAGTTVCDDINGVPLVIHVLQRVFASSPYHITLTAESINPHRGRKKRDMVQRLVKENLTQMEKNSGTSLSTAASESSVVDSLFSSFERLLASSLDGLNQEIGNASDVFKKLKQQGIKVAVGSGFSEQVVDRIVTNLNWRQLELLDYVGSAAQSGSGRPDPTMIRDAMNKLNIKEARNVLKIGDTVVDVEEGKNAGAITVAVLSGTQTKEQLQRAKPDFIIPSVAHLFSIWTQINQLASKTTSASLPAKL